MTRPWLSVVTVVRNDEPGLVRSLASLATQALDGVELVVVDGSDDRGEVPAALAAADLPCPVRSTWEPPRGIYPAMNVALESAEGSLVHFLNAGDSYFDAHVLRRSRPLLDGAAWGFGPIEIVEPDGTHVFPPALDYAAERHRGFARGSFPAHQGTFADRSLLRRLGGFDTSYAIAADYAMALRLAIEAEPVLLPFVVATFREGGASTQRRSLAMAEFHRARVEILRPTGLAAARERLDTAAEAAARWSAREALPRLRSLVRGPE